MTDYPRRRRAGTPRVDDLFYDTDPDPVEQGRGSEDPDDGDGTADDDLVRDRETADTGTSAAVPPPARDTVRSRRRRFRLLGRVGRSVTIAAVATALVYAVETGRVEPVDLATSMGREVSVPQGSGRESGLAVVEDATIGCVGPEQVGLDDPSVAEPEQTVSVYVASAPTEALPEGVDTTGTGRAHVSVVPGAETERVRERGELARLQVPGDTWGRGTAQGSLAAGFAGSQLGLTLEEQRRGLTMAACQTAREDSWLVGGGAEPGRVERLILANPTGNPVSVDVAVLGAQGPVAAPGARGIVVPAGGRQVVLLDALAPGEESPVLHVRTTGGPVLAALGDRWLEGTLDRGTELTTPAAPPSTTLVIPAVPAGGGEADTASVRVAVPGDEEAVVLLRALTPEGPVRLSNGVTRVGAGAVVDVDVSDLPSGAHAIEVEADTPVVAAAQVDRRAEPDGVSDLAWVPAVQPSTGLVGAPLAHRGIDLLQRELTIAALEGARVEVVAVVAGVASVRPVDVPPAGSVSVVLDPATESVWVRTVTGSASSAVVSTLEDDAGTLIAGMPLPEAPTTRQVRSVAPWLP